MIQKISIASQVSNTLMTFSSNFSVALRPQIIKSYAQNQKNESYSLVYRGSRLCFFLFLLPGVPIFLNTDYILLIWLKNIPDKSVLFTRLVLFDCLIDAMRFPLLALMHAQGNMKLYQTSVSVFLLLNLPLSYLFLKLGMAASSVMILAIFLSLLSLLVRVFVLKRLAGLPVKKYLYNVFVRCFCVFGLSSVVPILLYSNYSCTSFFAFVLQSGGCVLWSLIIILLIGMNSSERRTIANIIFKKIRGL